MQTNKLIAQCHRAKIVCKASSRYRLKFIMEGGLVTSVILLVSVMYDRAAVTACASHEATYLLI